MIQRIQSIYFLAVFALAVANYFLTVSSKIGTTDPSLVYKMDMFNISLIKGGQVSVVADVVFNAGLNGAIGLLSLFAIFQFKKRGLQLKICKVLMLLSAAFVGLLFYETDRMIPGTSENFKTIYLPAIYSSVLMLVFVFLAQKGIKKDDDLVRSVDRIR